MKQLIITAIHTAETIRDEKNVPILVSEKAIKCQFRYKITASRAKYKINCRLFLFQRRSGIYPKLLQAERQAEQVSAGVSSLITAERSRLGA